MMEKSIKLMSLEEPSTGQTTSCLSNNSPGTVEILQMLFLPECGGLFCTLYHLHFSTNKSYKVLKIIGMWGPKPWLMPSKTSCSASKLTYPCVQKVSDMIFFPWKLMKHGRCAVVGRWRVPLCAYVDFFLAADSISRMQPVCEWECIHSTRRILRKWRNDSSSSIASNFARSLAIAKWKPFRRFSGFWRRWYGHHTN